MKSYGNIMKINLLAGMALLGTAAGDPVSAAEIDAAWAVTATAPSGVFTEAEPLCFHLRDGLKAPVDYQVTDAFGKTIAKGQWPADGKGELKPAALPRGYYTISLSGKDNTYPGSFSFGVVAPPTAKPLNPDMPYAIDSAHSWCAEAKPNNPRFPGDGFLLMTELAHRAGFAYLRDRWSWSAVEQKPGVTTYWQFLPNAQNLAKHGIQTSVVYHDAPHWSKRGPTDLPYDLLASYHFAKKSAAESRGAIGAWEFWNEEDAAFTNEPAWEYAANLKAAALGYKAGNPDAVVLNGAFCVIPTRKFSYAVMENDIAKYIDAFNHHYYAELYNYPEGIDSIRKLMKQYGIGNMPLWITENGTGAPGDAKLQSYLPGLKGYSPGQEMIVAEFVTKSQIILQSLGVTRSFFFVLSPYNEGLRDWGLFRKDYTSRPGYFSFATLIREVGAAKYLGELNVPTGIRAFLFEQPDHTQSVVFWSNSDLDTLPNEKINSEKFQLYPRTLTLNAPVGSYAIRNIFGTPSKEEAVAGKLTLHANRYPEYVHGLSGLAAAIPAPQAAVPGPKANNDDRTIVMRPVLSDDFIGSNGRDSVDMRGPEGKMTLELYNFSDEKKVGKVQVTSGTVTGLPDEITIPAMGKVELPLVFRHALKEKEVRGSIEFTGDFNGKPVSKLHIPLFLLSREVKFAKKLELDGIQNPKRWYPNSSGKMTTFFDEKAGAICFEVDYSPGVDRWIYPEFPLNLPRETFANATGVSFEIKVEATEPMKEAYFMVVYRKGITDGHHPGPNDDAFIRYPIPSGKWETRTLSFNEFVTKDPAKITKIRLGVNPKSDHIRYWIRNLQIVYGK